MVGQPHLKFQQLYDAELAVGIGTVDERAVVSAMLATWKETHERLQMELRTLSSNSRYRVLDCGHDIPVIEPNAVVDEVLWVLAEGKKCSTDRT